MPGPDAPHSRGCAANRLVDLSSAVRLCVLELRPSGPFAMSRMSTSGVVATQQLQLRQCITARLEPHHSTGMGARHARVLLGIVARDLPDREGIPVIRGRAPSCSRTESFLPAFHHRSARRATPSPPIGQFRLRDSRASVMHRREVVLASRSDRWHGYLWIYICYTYMEGSRTKMRSRVALRP
jgi:hypothetical protein